MNNAAPEPAGIYLQLRDHILNLNPAEVGLAPSNEAPHVWGVVVETGYDVGSATLLSLADGTTSLYYSTGGGMLGSGDYSPVAEASKALVVQAEILLPKISSSTGFPLPDVGQVRFIILTYSGIFAATAAEKKLADGSHPLSSLFFQAQNTLTQLHLSAEKKPK